MRAIVLGSSAGGGFPQWNCGCPNCVAVRAHKEGFLARTQDSMAITRTGGSTFAVVNASPEILAQVQATPALHPRAARHSPIGAILLTNGDMDHILGLFSLRESWPFALYVTSAVRRGLEQSVFLRTLRRFEGQLVVRDLVIGETTALADAQGEPIGISVKPFPAAGKLPVHFVGHEKESPEDNVGLSFTEPGRSGSLAYAAACATAEEGLALEGHDVVLFDGTFYREDELVRLGLSKAMAKSMAHVPIGGEEGSLVGLRALSAKRKIFTHINNTNPILDPNSEERRAVEAAGWEVAWDGMEIDL